MSSSQAAPAAKFVDCCFRPLSQHCSRSGEFIFEDGERYRPARLWREAHETARTAVVYLDMVAKQHLLDRYLAARAGHGIPIFSA